MKKRRPKPYEAPPKNAFSARLEHVRKTKAGNVTRKEFHRLLSAQPQSDGSPFTVSYSAARNYHYDREPSPSYIAQVAKVFGVPIEFLFQGEGPAARSPDEARKWDQQQLRIAVFQAVRSELGALSPIGVGGIDEMILLAVPAVARSMQLAGDSHGDDDHARYLEAASSLGRAVTAPLQALGLEPAHWTQAVKAQYVLQAMAALLVPLDIEFARNAVEQSAAREAEMPKERKGPPPKRASIPVYWSEAARQLATAPRVKRRSK